MIHLLLIVSLLLHPGAASIRELERLRRVISGNFHRDEWWPGLVFEAASCPLNYLNQTKGNQCACFHEYSDTTVALACGEDHVVCSVEFASYGTVRGACGSTPLHPRSLQEGQCSTSDLNGEISARAIIMEACEGRQHCLINRCMMQRSDARMSPCIQQQQQQQQQQTSGSNIHNDISWGVVVQNCAPKNTCLGATHERDGDGFEGLERLEEEATSMLHGSLVLATALRTQGTRKFYFTSATSQKHRLKACPHVANCPSCACAYVPPTVIAQVDTTIIFTTKQRINNNININIKEDTQDTIDTATTHIEWSDQNNVDYSVILSLQCTGQLPIIPRLTVVSSMPTALVAEFVPQNDECGSSFIVLRIFPRDSAIITTSTSMKVSIYENATKLSEINVVLEPPPEIIFDVNSAENSDDGCSLTVGMRSNIGVSSAGAHPTIIKARSGQLQTLLDDEFEFRNISTARDGTRDRHEHQLFVVAKAPGAVILHFFVEDGNGVQVTKTLTCRAREPPMITIFDQSPITITVGYERHVRYLVVGHPSLNLHITSRVSKVLSARHLTYQNFLTGESSSESQVMIIAAPTKAQVGTTSFNFSVVDGNGARTETVDLVCEIVARPSIALYRSKLRVTELHTSVVPISIYGFDIETLRVTSSQPTVVPDTMVLLQFNDDKTYELHITGLHAGDTKLTFVAVDGNGAVSKPVSINTNVVAPPSISILHNRNIVVVLDSKTGGTVRGSNFVEAVVTGSLPINIVTMSSNLDVINPANGHVSIEGSGEKRKITVKTSQQRLGTAVIRCVATDANGASVSIDFQVDIVEEQVKSKHRLWQERNKK